MSAGRAAAATHASWHLRKNGAPMETIFAAILFAVLFVGVSLLLPPDEQMDPVNRLDLRLLLMRHH